MKKILLYMSRFFLAVILTCSLSITAFAVEDYALDNQIKITSSEGSISVSGTTVDFSVTSGTVSSKTSTIEIYNNTSSAATISFDYSASTSNTTFTLVGSTATSGSYSHLVAAGESISLSLKATNGFLSKKTAKLTLSNLSLVEAAAASEVTFAFDDTLGSITVDGTAMTSSGTAQNVPLTGSALVAKPSGSNQFLGWIDVTDHNKILSTSTSYTLTPAADMTVKAVFVSGSAPNACFKVGDYLFEKLDEADTFAKTAASRTIVLVNNGTLPSGNYTISSGNTLLIPYNSSNTLCTTAPTVNDSSIVAPTAYRTLTMAEGASIIVNGGLSVSGSQTAAYPVNGQVTGPVGVINMASGSSITVNSGGSLYAWGYVAGSGTVTIESGGKVYEDFQVRDYRGGDVTTTLASSSGSNVKTWHIFPMSQYYVQNVQVPMTLKAGASEFCYFSVTASLMGIKSETVNFIGADSMFQITNGYITKDYDESTDRLNIDVYGNLEVNPFSIEIQVKGLSSAITINSANYDLPLNSNITIKMKGGSIVDLNQDLLMLPGSEIGIGANATLNVNDGKRLIVYDNAQWGLYCSDLNKAVVPLAYVFNGTKGAAPAYTRTTNDLVDAKILVDGTLNAANGYLYTTEGGGNICSSGNGQIFVQQSPEATAYQIEQKRNGDDDFDSSTELDAHPITSAQLLNGDGSYLQSGANTYTYQGTGTDGRWVCATHVDAGKDNVCDACGKECVAEVDGTSYFTLSEAVKVANGNVITMLSDSDETDCTITGEVYLDLNGCDVTGVTLSGTLYGADSRTDDYGISGAAYGTLTLAKTTSVPTLSAVNGKTYVAYHDGTAYSFHRVAVAPVAYQYYYNEKAHSHMAFQAAFLGDVTATSLVQDIGFEITGGSTVGAGVTVPSGVQWYGSAPNFKAAAEQKLFSFVALDYEGTTGFDNTYTATAYIAFGGKTEAEQISKAASTAVSFNMALQQGVKETQEG